MILKIFYLHSFEHIQLNTKHSVCCHLKNWDDLFCEALLRGDRGSKGNKGKRKGGKMEHWIGRGKGREKVITLPKQPK